MTPHTPKVQHQVPTIPARPPLGLGTWKSSPGEVRDAVGTALDLGYRHIDCAPAYENESEVGSAIAGAIASGTVSRQELWVTSKLWCNAHAPEHVQAALEKTLRDLRLDSLDLYLIHWPVAFRHEVFFPRSGADYIPLTDLPTIATWRAMEACVEKGLTRHIGVCNFSIKKLDALRREAAIPPAVNQIELHPYLRQQPMLDYCRQHGILLTAYSPLGSGDRPRGLKKGDEPVLLQDPEIGRIAARHGILPGQVLLAWALQRGTIAIPKSVNPARLKQNLQAANIRLDDSDMAAIAALDRGYRYVDGSFWQAPGSPYTLAGLWDE